MDSDGSGEIDVDELKILLRPMMSLSDRAGFQVSSVSFDRKFIISDTKCIVSNTKQVNLEPNYGICGGKSELVVSGIPIQNDELCV